MYRWPWVTTLLTALLVVSPPGREIIYSAFYSGEALARSIGQFLAMVVAGIVVALAVIEVLIGMLIRHLRRRKVTET